MSEPITNVEAAVAELGALPMPVGPEPWSQAAARDEFERILREKFRLQESLTQALRDAAGARRERDRIRERVSEPYGCTHCGEAKRSHGRQYLSGVGMHAWERPSDEQVKDRMLARRAAGMALPSNLSLWEEGPATARLRERVAELKAERADEHDELALALGRSNGTEWGDLIEYAAGAVAVEAKWERHRAELTAFRNDALNMRGSLSPNGEDRKVPFPLGETLTPAVDWLIARVAELEAERHVTNEALSDAAVQLRANRDRIAELERPAEERRRAEIRSSYTELIAQAEQDRDYEGAAVVQQQLAERESVWAREDELAKEFARDPLAMKPYVPGPSVQASADKLTRMLAPTQALSLEDPHDSPLHREHRLGRELPETGGAR